MFPTLENVPAIPGLSQNAAVSESMSLILKKKEQIIEFFLQFRIL